MSVQSSLKSILQFASIAIYYAIIAAFIRDFVWLKRICLGWIIGVSVTAGLALIQRFGGIHLYVMSASHREVGFVGDPNLFALEVVVVPLIFVEILGREELYKKIAFFSLLPINLLAVAFSFSRGGFLSSLSMLMLILIRFRHSKLVILLFIGSALTAATIFPKGYWYRMNCILAIPTAENFRSLSVASRRVEILKASPYVFLESPLIGVGVGNVSYRIMEHSSYLKSPVVAHNMYLEVLLGTGLLGFLPFMLLLWFTWRDLRYVQSVSPESPLSLYTKGLEISFLTFLVGATFLSIPYSKILWLLFGLSTSLKHIALNDAKDSTQRLLS